MSLSDSKTLTFTVKVPESVLGLASAWEGKDRGPRMIVEKLIRDGLLHYAGFGREALEGLSVVQHVVDRTASYGYGTTYLLIGMAEVLHDLTKSENEVIKAGSRVRVYEDTLGNGYLVKFPGANELSGFFVREAFRLLPKVGVDD